MHTNNLLHHHIHVYGLLSGGINILAVCAMIPCMWLDNKRDTTHLDRNKKTHICTRHFGMHFHHRLIILIPIILTFVPWEAFDTKSSLEKVMIGPQQTTKHCLTKEDLLHSYICARSSLAELKICLVTSLNAFFLLKMFEFRLAFHWSLFLWV